MQSEIRTSYRIAARISRNASSSFYPSFWLLPKRKRLAMCAFYAFARLTDDVADLDIASQLKQDWLSNWRSVVSDSLSSSATQATEMPYVSGKLSKHATLVLPALRDVVHRYGIDPNLILQIIEGALLDQQKVRFDTYNQLESYCYLVASTVGLVCVSIWGSEGSRTQDAAIACGKAFQMTNILRDIHEDDLQNRYYLPIEDGNKFNVDVTKISDTRQSGWNELLRYECDRTSELFDKGWETSQGIHPDGQPMFSMMWRSYRSLLSEIEREPAKVLHHRVRIPSSNRLRIAASHFVSPIFRRLPSPVEGSLT